MLAVGATAQWRCGVQKLPMQRAAHVLRLRSPRVAMHYGRSTILGA